MKKGINLITKRKKYLQYEKFFYRLKEIVLLMGILLLFLAISLNLYLFKQNQKLTKLINEKKGLLEFIAKNKEVEAEFVYFRNKQNRLMSILKEDVNFLPYYNLITDSFKTASPEPRVDNIVITKDRAINLSLTFDDSNSMVLFLKFAESENFLKNFSELIVSQFKIGMEKNSKGYQLNLVGKLNPIDETKN